VKLGEYNTNQLYCGDCLELMKSIPDEAIDLVITDPPFGIEFKAKKLNYNRKGGRVIEGYQEIAKENYPVFTHSWLSQVYRILNPTGSIYVFSGWNNLKDILNALDDVGFITINHIIWKYQFGVFTRRKFVTSHYHVLFAVKDAKQYVFNKIDHYPEDVWVIKREYWSGKVKTPTKLPRELVQKIIRYSSNEGCLIFDPFLGSGTVAEVAATLRRRFLGFEIVPDYYRFACERLKEIQQSF